MVLKNILNNYASAWVPKKKTFWLKLRMSTIKLDVKDTYTQAHTHTKKTNSSMNTHIPSYKVFIASL